MPNQAKASNLSFYDIVASQKVPLSKIYDDVFARDLWFGPPLFKNHDYAYATPGGGGGRSESPPSSGAIWAVFLFV